MQFVSLDKYRKSKTLFKSSLNLLGHPYPASERPVLGHPVSWIWETSIGTPCILHLRDQYWDTLHPASERPVFGMVWGFNAFLIYVELVSTLRLASTWPPWRSSSEDERKMIEIIFVYTEIIFVYTVHVFTLIIDFGKEFC